MLYLGNEKIGEVTFVDNAKVTNPLSELYWEGEDLVFEKSKGFTLRKYKVIDEYGEYPNITLEELIELSNQDYYEQDAFIKDNIVYIYSHYYNDWVPYEESSKIIVDYTKIIQADYNVPVYIGGANAGWVWEDYYVVKLK